MGQKIRVLLVDDHAMLREGTAAMLRREEDIEIVGEAANGWQAIDLTRQLEPDLVVMDIRMPLLSGVDATRLIRRSHPLVQVLVLTAHDDDAYVFSLLQAGASGYLLKSAPISELVKSIRMVRAGESPLDPAITHKIVISMKGGRMTPPPPEPDAPPVEALTVRELEVLQLLARGRSNREIGEALVISDRTAQAHLTNIFAKMKVSSRLEAVLKAIRLGWLTLEM